jgi:ankyrin repeat protein
VSFVIKQGADVNATDKRRYTPLNWAVLLKRLENVKVLIREGAEVDATEHGDKHTALHLACIAGARSIIKELMKAGAEVNQLNTLGITPMYYVRNNENIVEFMEKQGGEIRDRPEICDEAEELMGKMVEILGRNFLPDFEGKVISLDEIKKRDGSLK